MSKYEITDIPDFTNEQRDELDILQANADGSTTLDDREKLLKMQWLEAAYDAKIKWNTKLAVDCYERFKRLD